ncbi:hypothetical protein BDN72DRAFT_896092 [Pluteus cervinus]|uniref:Uncharacterized protein n=1 Tax=Pluteus cervinus TaxID=181527 RepID=A0ACD3AZW3_9AGAR|nr:hypothetical protein BDN72DRAFT_896092 [Pluteus cervinus]
MASDNSPLHYRSLVHFIRYCNSAIYYDPMANEPDPTTQHLLTPCPRGYHEVVVNCRDTMLATTPRRSFGVLPRILEAIAAISVSAPRRQFNATGFQIDRTLKRVTLTISTNAPIGTHGDLRVYVNEIWRILSHLASSPLPHDEAKLQAQLRDLIFAWTLPKIQRQLEGLGPSFPEWVEVLQKHAGKAKPRPPFDEPDTHEFASKLAELANEILKAVDALPHLTPGGPQYREVQEVVMISVPRIIEELRKIETYPDLWKPVALEIGCLQKDMGEWAVYDHFAKISAFSTHTNALISAAHAENQSKLFSVYELTLVILPPIPHLHYTFPPPPTSQDTAQALVDKILEAGDPDNRWYLNRQFIKYHVKLAPKDNQSKVVVHTEIGLLVHYLKIMAAIARGEGGVLPMTYIGTSSLQCGFCQAAFRVLESLFSEVVGSSTSLPFPSLKFDTRGTDRLFQSNWGWPEGLVEAMEGILSAVKPESSALDAFAPPEAGGTVPPSSGSIPVPVGVEEKVMGMFTTKLSELLCEEWKLLEEDLIHDMLMESWDEVEFMLPGVTLR